MLEAQRLRGTKTKRQKAKMFTDRHRKSQRHGETERNQDKNDIRPRSRQNRRKKHTHKEIRTELARNS